MTANDSVTLTLDYYNQNARGFCDSTVNVEFSSTQDKFLALLPAAGSVLDFGCGSGRDTRYFLQRGFDVTAVDGSVELCRIAEELCGIKVRNELFCDLDECEAYDGIWACSSILHVAKDELPEVFARMRRALKPNGVIYTSFKYGTFEGMRNGRYFSNFTEQEFAEFLQPLEGLELEESWTTSDVRPGRGDEQWLNLLIRKTR